MAKAMSNDLNKEFRSDVQGVRAVGAILVAVFHIWVGGVSGGVDVFFVISGYFMASGLLALYEKGQTLSLVAYYQNFLLKIAPQAVFLLGVLLLTSFFFINPVSYLTLLKDIAASAAYMQNWHLINVGQDYLSRTGSLNLLQHFWAISIIGQAYLFWPILVGSAEKFALLIDVNKERVQVCLVVTLSVLSFLWAVYSLRVHPQSAYFDSFARYWQFGVGILVGLFPCVRSRISWRLANPLSFVGLLLLLTCGYFIGDSGTFPGYGSLWPVAAALLIIVTGFSDSGFNAGKLLSSEPLVWLASISFGIYLWHWPIFAVYMEYSKGIAPSLLTGLVIIILAIVLASCFKLLSETFVRFARQRFGNILSSLLILLTLMCIFLGTVLFQKIAWKYRQEVEVIVNARQIMTLDQGPFSVRDDIPAVYANGCHQDIESSEVSECIINPLGKSATLVVVGGSHATHWLPAFEQIAVEKDWKIISVTKSACLFGDVSDEGLFDDRDPSCKIWNEQVYQRVVEIKPQMVFTILTRTYRSEIGLEERIPKGYMTAFEKLSDHGIKVFAMRDNPWMGYDVPSCWFSPWRTSIKDCDQPRDKVLNDNQYEVELIAVDDRVEVIDLTDEFCDNEICHVVNDKILMYRDSHHITSTYSKKLALVLQSKLLKTE